MDASPAGTQPRHERGNGAADGRIGDVGAGADEAWARSAAAAPCVPPLGQRTRARCSRQGHSPPSTPGVRVNPSHREAERPARRLGAAPQFSAPQGAIPPSPRADPCPLPMRSAPSDPRCSAPFRSCPHARAWGTQCRARHARWGRARRTLRQYTAPSTSRAGSACPTTTRGTPQRPTRWVGKASRWAAR